MIWKRSEKCQTCHLEGFPFPIYFGAIMFYYYCTTVKVSFISNQLFALSSWVKSCWEVSAWINLIDLLASCKTYNYNGTTANIGCKMFRIIQVIGGDYVFSSLNCKKSLRYLVQAQELAHDGYIVLEYESWMCCIGLARHVSASHVALCCLSSWRSCWVTCSPM